MIADAIKQSAAVTGGAAMCAQLVNSPVANALIMIIVLLTCAVVMGHILINCWITNRRAKRKREAARGRTGETDTP